MAKDTCADCGKELGFVKLKPTQKEWGVEGYLCRECYHKRVESDKENAPIVSGKALLFGDELTNDEIKERILQDMRNLQSHEAGSGWMRLGTLLNGNSTDQILGAGLKALIDQNKIIIRQNELILRALNKESPASPSP
jgi:DNA-directed RNA polymerase subunit RPC12/RpoP